MGLEKAWGGIQVKEGALDAGSKQGCVAGVLVIHKELTGAEQRRAKQRETGKGV